MAESYFDETLSRTVRMPGRVFVMDLEKRPAQVSGGNAMRNDAEIDFRELRNRKKLMKEFLFLLDFCCENSNEIARFVYLNPERIPMPKLLAQEKLGEKMDALALERFGRDLKIVYDRETAKKAKESVIVREYGGGDTMTLMRLWHTFVGGRKSLKFPVVETGGGFVPEYDQENNPGGFVYSLIE
jgi:hypothetical protein